MTALRWFSGIDSTHLRIAGRFSAPSRAPSCATCSRASPSRSESTFDCSSGLMTVAPPSLDSIAARFTSTWRENWRTSTGRCMLRTTSGSMPRSARRRSNSAR